ncbi:MAG: DUF1003 domain-containing protein [Candidatus Pacebacteria bacterium]|nr:DUF1003 domain-containing protein [Candidatus Paceibacterota bacterium]MBP9839488.1 DUF1003 domain-containing protein [Candidatus Paceibacterota bacterium]MDQ5922495.1 hypothetical protein [Patescibacteria group bacterium]
MNKKMTKFSEKLITWIGSMQSLVVHTIFFSSIFILGFSGIVDAEKVFSVTTNILSIEAIYLAIFIQMTVSKHSEDLEEVSEDIDEIQKDVDEIQEDVDEIQKDVDEIQEDVEDITEDVEEHGENIQNPLFAKIENNLAELMKEIAELKNKKGSN